MTQPATYRQLVRPQEISQGQGFVYFAPVHSTRDSAQLLLIIAPAAMDKSFGISVKLYRYGPARSQVYIDALVDMGRFGGYEEMRAHMKAHDLCTGMMPLMSEKYDRTELAELRRIHPEVKEKMCPYMEYMGDPKHDGPALQQALDNMEHAGMLTNHPEYNQLLKAMISQLAVSDPSLSDDVLQHMPPAHVQALACHTTKGIANDNRAR